MQSDMSAFLRTLDISHDGASENDGRNEKHARMEQQEVFDQHEVSLEDSELHFDADKGDVIFDYGTREIVGTPDNIGEHISQILESVLPSGLQKEAQRKLKEMVNKDQVGEPSADSFVDLHDAMHNLQRLQNVKQLRQPRDANEHTGAVDTERKVNVGDTMTQEPPSELQVSSDTFRSSDKPASQPPNFSVLISEKKPVCLFCEYHMVFGEPPRNMIKWYNRVSRYENLPTNEDRKRKHSRKRNR